MALIEFKDLPDTSTPLNAETLNYNFKQLNDKTETKIITGEEVATNKYVDGKQPIIKKVLNLMQ